MACVTGTNIVNDGLVFHFDLENGAKSWKGKPTSNLAVGKFFDGNNNFTTDETIQDILPDGSVGPVRYLNADYVVDSNRTVSIGNYSLTAGETYTLSFYVKNIDCTGFGGNLYSPGLGRVIGGIVYPTIYTDRWTRVITTFTVPDEGVNPVSVSPQAFRDGGYGFFKMCWLQMEQGDVATKYINGIRLDTASIIDVSPTQSTITAANLTYRQDDTPTFDGTNDYIDTGFGNYSSNEITLESWFKFGLTSGTKTIIGRGNINTVDEIDLIFGYSNPFKLVARFAGPSSQVTYDWPTEHVNVWKNAVMTVKDNGSSRTATLYIDGDEVNSTTTGFSISSYTNQFYIGKLDGATPYYYQGEISQVKIYNRALTTQEVKQNFESTRTRYGI